ncbi:hypothetical protein BDW42DRAFT_173149 [Aspergillus taichungensis]|uniref:G-protein coupled receptors family 2 profile 2 domain-containing protein n=1 Tax=Aspergillus taichungensis TaxID=482145 RepID=A0A2J5HPZ6_9EURO|nr:hypothetical protein BDW42DRAFT_173149 [Aspergillus taichungensis]
MNSFEDRSMGNQTLNGVCPPPFLQESLFPSEGGFIGGRYCKQIPITGIEASCCLPCPMAEWRYGEDIEPKSQIASWLAVATLPLCLSILISYAVLPVKTTHRHYLSICITLGIAFMEIAFIIPLGIKPNQCYNQITPNDMYSDISCAFTGAFLLFGGWMVIIWSFIRTVAFHLQVCWEVIIGRKFMYGALICGWGIPAIGLAVMMVFTGVSYRFGGTCHVNIKHSVQDYWAPMMAFAAAALVVQTVTMGYCIRIYVKSVFDQSSTTNSSALPSYSASVRTVSARHAYRRIRRVLQLQWRGAALVLIIIGNVIFFAVIFMTMDRQLEVTPENTVEAMPWLLCLIEKQGDSAACAHKFSELGPNEATLLAVLILLSLVGLWNFILLARPSMFAGWIDLFRSRRSQRNEFVSVDARKRQPTDPRTYEMLNSMKSPDSAVLRTPSPAFTAGTLSPVPGGGSHGREARYVRPSMSFSGPRPPTSPRGGPGREWDPEATFARGTTYRGA